MLLSASVVLLKPIPARPEMLLPVVNQSEGSLWSVVDIKGNPIPDAMLIPLSNTVQVGNSGLELERIGEELKLDLSSESIARAIRDYVIKYIDYWELYTNNIDYLHYFQGKAGSFYTDVNGSIECKTVNKCSLVYSGFDTIGNYWLIVKAGYYPEVVYDDWKSAPRDAMRKFRIVLTVWPERKADLINRDYVFEKNNIDKAYQSRGIGYIEYLKDRVIKKLHDVTGRPNKTMNIVESYKALISKAKQKGKLKDAAWLTADLAIVDFGENGMGGTGVDDLENGRHWKYIEAASALVPDELPFQTALSTRKLWKRFYSNVKSLNPEDNTTYLDWERKWDEGDIAAYEKAVDDISKDPLAALGIEMVVGGEGFQSSDVKIQDRFFRCRMKLFKDVISKYPSFVWFTLSYDYAAATWMYSSINSAKRPPYPIKYKWLLSK